MAHEQLLHILAFESIANYNYGQDIGSSKPIAVSTIEKSIPSLL